MKIIVSSLNKLFLDKIMLWWKHTRMGKRIKTVPGIKREREAGLVINKLHLLIMSTHRHNLNYNSYRKKH